MEQPTENIDKIDIAKSELQIYVDLYKDHFTLWLKGYAVYLAILGALVGIFFKKETTTTVKYVLCVVFVSVSISSGIACSMALKWLNSVKNRIAEVSDILRIKPFPIFGAVGIGWVATVVCVIFSMIGILFTIGISKGLF